MTAIPRSPLDGWMAQQVGVAASNLTRSSISAYQLQALRNTIAWARTRSSFYARELASFGDEPLQSVSDLAGLPFTTSEDLVQHGPQFLCVSQDEISRIVTFTSSGTTGLPKRVFSTRDDQERALDFFAAGVTAIVAPGERMLIALPCEREGSVGYQLARGIVRAGVIPVAHGLIHGPSHVLEIMERERVASIIGFPVHMLALARHPSAIASRVLRRLRSMVLCSDHVPDSLVGALRRRSDCEIFEHYGSTEMGLGGGVDCLAHAGYHMREADLFFEIVSPETGEPVADGMPGEVVFTTLHSAGMPLIRYRTRDISRILSGQCACGSVGLRLERIHHRVGSAVNVPSCGEVSMSMLDEALFAVPGLLDFRATISLRDPMRMALTIFGYGHARSAAFIRKTLEAVPSIGAAFASECLKFDLTYADKPFPATAAKRSLTLSEAA